MHEQDRAILKSLVSVAWADGHVSSEETEIIEALLQAFEANPEEAAEIREYAKSPRTLADIPLTELSADDRRILLQHAVLITFIDGEQAAEEKSLITDLCDKLRIPPDEAKSLLGAAEGRAKRFLDLL
jgi:prepilin-type processing-associated H-X9-DG protein